MNDSSLLETLSLRRDSPPDEDLGMTPEEAEEEWQRQEEARKEAERMAKMDSQIQDRRGPHDFRGVTFSGFKKTDVVKELMHSLTHSKIEPACYWSAELICAGQFVDLWSVFISFFGKFVHQSSCPIAVYLESRLKTFKAIADQGYTDNLLFLRNEKNIRKLFCEIACVLCDAKRRHSFDNVKIKPEELHIVAIKDKFTAPSTTYGDESLMTEDPRELFPFVNELAYCVTPSGANTMLACYWVEWMHEYEQRCKALKEKKQCELRMFVKVDNKFRKDLVWIVWDVLLAETRRRRNKLLEKIVTSLLALFSFKYSTGGYRRRKNLVYLSITLLCEPVTLDKEIIRRHQMPVVASVQEKIDQVYHQIKKNEESARCDYMFHGLTMNHMESTIKQLELMAAADAFVPRTA